MFLIRQARADDAATLLRFGRMVHSKNLPTAHDLILGKVRRSRRSFIGEVTERTEREFLFVLEDTQTGNVIGTSSIIAALGGPDRPHLYLQVRKHEHYSQDLQTGQVHVTLQLQADDSGPTEIGGLILSPTYRGRQEHLGSLLSLVRFHFIGLHRDWFAERIVAEMMGPLTPDSRNTLWDYLGRRFINLSYEEADRFSRDSKEFVLSLLPRGEIYVSLLPPEARNLIGKVGSEAEPALGMLKRM
ncbi:MAG: arginine N-succinyltransferase, partial [Planctomycetota bacterium]